MKRAKSKKSYKSDQFYCFSSGGKSEMGQGLVKDVTKGVPGEAIPKDDYAVRSTYLQATQGLPKIK